MTTYYAPKDIANALGITPRRVHNWVNRPGILPEASAVTVSGTKLWTKEVAEDFIAHRRRWVEKNTRVYTERQLEIAKAALTKGR